MSSYPHCDRNSTGAIGSSCNEYLVKLSISQPASQSTCHVQYMSSNCNDIGLVQSYLYLQPAGITVKTGVFIRVLGHNNMYTQPKTHLDMTSEIN